MVEKKKTTQQNVHAQKIAALNDLDVILITCIAGYSLADFFQHFNHIFQ